MRIVGYALAALGVLMAVATFALFGLAIWFEPTDKFGYSALLTFAAAVVTGLPGQYLLEVNPGDRDGY